MDLLDRIDSITLPPQQTTIPQADREALEQLHTDYKELEAELLAAEEALANIPVNSPCR